MPDRKSVRREATKGSFAVSSGDQLGTRALQAPVVIVVTVSVHCRINMLGIVIFWLFCSRVVFIREMICMGKGVSTLEDRKSVV